MAMKKDERVKAVLDTVALITGHVKSYGITDVQIQEWYQEQGLHHLLLEIAVPDIDDASDERYGELLDRFEDMLVKAIAKSG